MLEAYYGEWHCGAMDDVAEPILHTLALYKGGGGGGGGERKGKTISCLLLALSSLSLSLSLCWVMTILYD